MINENIDLPKELLYKEGNIWVNRKNNQLRYNVKDNETAWLNPISTYKVGTIETLKKGQPVSIGLLSQLCTEASGVGDNAIVLADPSINQFSVGLLLEPGDVSSTKEVHVQSHGQFVYELKNLYSENSESYYFPPNDGQKFLWSYDDIGKPVYVSNKNKGELTLNLAEATYDGGTIICIGRIADAPLGIEHEISDQKIIIEIQLSGDVRGVVDTSQLSVMMQQFTAQTVESIKSDYDLIVPVKIVNGIGQIITKTEDLRNNSQSDIVGVFVAPSKNGNVDLKPFYGKSITVTRLGIVNGNFGFNPDTFGKTGYICDGKLSFIDIDDGVEYKVGVGFGVNKFLVDCRYAKSIKSAEMIGTIKPVFDNDLVDVGFVKIDQEVHKIYDEEIEWESLIRYCYAKDIFVFSKNKNGPFTRVNEGNWELLGEQTDNGILSRTRPTYFKFRDIYYTLNDGQTCACQIKYTKEGSPENQAYVWPEQCYQLTVPYKSNGTAGGKLNNSNLRINITHLVELGAYMDNKGQNIESYDIIVQEKESKQIISPGFWQTPKGVWVGYEWQIVTTENNETFLYMITVPENVEASNCMGVTWPIGTKYNGDIELFVTVRRRPTQYNAIYLNQYPHDNPWTPLVDSANNLVIQGNRIYLGGKLEQNVGNSGFTREKSTSIEVLDKDSDEAASVTYHIISPTEDNANKFIERFVIGDGTNSKTIQWTFDVSGDVPKASLNANFEAQFTAESTKDENPTEEYKDSALKIFKVLYPHIYEKKSNQIETISITNKRIEDFLEDGYNFSLFDEEIKNKLTQEKDPKLNTLKSDSKVLRAINDGWNNHDSIAFQSYFGLLARAAGETEERLLKLERFLFGLDFKNAYNSSNTLNTKYNYYIDDLGILRYFSFLEDYGLFDSNGELNLSSAGFNNMASAENIKSLLLNFLVDNYGAYSVLDTYTLAEDDTHKKISSSYQAFNNIKTKDELVEFLRQSSKDGFSKNGLSHLAELWIDYKTNHVFNQLLNNTRNLNVNNPVPMISANNNIRATELKNVYLSKLINGYNTDDVENESLKTAVPIEFKGSPFKWPIYDNGWEERSGFTVEENFFGNNIIGVADETQDYYAFNGGNSYSGDEYFVSENALQGKPATFSPQSLEGIIYDIIIKLSYLRKQFSVDGKFDSKRTFISTFSQMSFKNTTIPIFKPFDKGRMFNNMSDDRNVYSAFQFDDDKIVAAYSSTIGEKQSYYEFSNFDSFSENIGDGSTYIASRWDTNKWTLNINGYKFSNPSQIYMLYVLYCFSLIEKSIFDSATQALSSNSIMDSLDLSDPNVQAAIQNGDLSSYTNNQQNIVGLDLGIISGIQKYNKLVEDCFLYGKTLQSKATVTQSNTTAAFKNKTLCQAFVNALKLDLNLATSAINSGSGNSITNLINANFRLKLNYYDMALNKQGIKSAFSPKYDLNLNLIDDDDILNDWINRLINGYNAGADSITSAGFEISSLNTLLSIIASASGVDSISTVFLSNFFPTFESYKDGFKTISTQTLSTFYTRNSYLRKALSYSETNFTLNKAISEHYPKTSEYRLFFGFLNGITGKTSEYFIEEPWLQKPIANNELTWKDENGGIHSADFNDYINKQVNFIEDDDDNNNISFNESNEVTICNNIIEPKNGNDPLVTSNDIVFDTNSDEWLQARSLESEEDQSENSSILGYKDLGFFTQTTTVKFDSSKIIDKIRLTKNNFIYDESDLENEVKRIYEYVYEYEYEKDPETGDFILDELGNKIIVTDEEGNPVYAKDENGNNIIATDEDGNPIYAKDENGELKYEEIITDNIKPLIKEDTILDDEDNPTGEVKYTLEAKSLVGAVVALCQKVGIDYKDFINNYVNGENHEYDGKVFALPNRSTPFTVDLDVEYKYKEKMFYIKPLKNLTLSNNFNYGKISKLTEIGVNDNGNEDYMKETYKYNDTEVIDSSSKILKRKFAFKDNSYIHGHMLPHPDIKIKTKSEDLLNLIEMRYSEEPDVLKLSKTKGKEKVTPNIKFNEDFSLFDINDTFGRHIVLTLDDVKYVVTEMTICSIGITKLNDAITNAPLSFNAQFESRLDDDQINPIPQKTLFSAKQNYYVHCRVELKDKENPPTWIRIGAPSPEYNVQIGDNENYTASSINQYNIQYNNGSKKTLNFDTWGEFLIKNSDIVYSIDEKVAFKKDSRFVDYKDQSISSASEVDIREITSNLLPASSLILKGTIKYELE